MKYKFPNKHDWKMIDKHIVENPLLTNRQVAEKFNTAISTISWRRNLLGLGKMEMEYWTPIQIKWLQILYPFVGDLEIAQIFDEAYSKKKGWTLKHIEKKRLQLGLKRTKDQLKAIRERNRLFGCWMLGTRRAKETIGVAPVGEVRDWNGREYIKTEKGFEIHARFIWQINKGEIPKGMNVVKVNPFLPITIDNLELLSDSDLARRNSLHRYPYELRQTINSLKQLNKAINEKQNWRPA